MWQEVIDDLEELCEVIERGEEPGCYYRIEIVEKPTELEDVT